MACRVASTLLRIGSQTLRHQPVSTCRVLKLTAVRSLSTHNSLLSAKLYTKDHEWLAVDGDVGRVGITDHAQNALGEVVYVDLPAAGDEVDKDDVVGSIESVKAASDLIAPVAGEILEQNECLADAPNTVNSSPYENGWLYTMKLSDPSELEDMMSEEAYVEFLESEGH